MLTIEVPGVEFYDDDLELFVVRGARTLHLEHSLVSLSKWESIFEKPLLGPGEKTPEETVGYIKAMTLDEDIPPEVYSRLTEENVAQINSYIEAAMTATWGLDVPNQPQRPSEEIITSELIYYWMLSLNIPVSCEEWHLTRLITLIKVTNKKNSPPKKSNAKTLAEQRRALNESRQKKYNTTG